MCYLQYRMLFLPTSAINLLKFGNIMRVMSRSSDTLSQSGKVSGFPKEPSNSNWYCCVCKHKHLKRQSLIYIPCKIPQFVSRVQVRLLLRPVILINIPTRAVADKHSLIWTSHFLIIHVTDSQINAVIKVLVVFNQKVVVWTTTARISMCSIIRQNFTTDKISDSVDIYKWSLKIA